MRHIIRILPILAVAVIGAVLWADAQQNSPDNGRSLSPIAAIARVDTAGLPDGDELLAACQSRLLAHRSVSAQVRQRVQLYDRQLFGSGIYLQQGVVQLDNGQPDSPGRLQFRFELDFQLDNRKQGMVQSSDGVTLWLFDSNGSGAALRRVDLDRLALTVERFEMESGDAQPGRRVEPSPAAVDHGGLPRLLADLQKHFRFHTVGETEIAGVGVWVVQGTWRPDRLKQLSQHGDKKKSAAREANIDITQFGPQVPHDVLLYLDRDELFPYRIQYRRLEKLNNDSAARPRTLVEMELFQVRFDALIDLNQFAKPIDITAVDHTDAYAKRLVSGNEE